MRFPQYFGLFLSFLSFIACGGAATEDTTISTSETINTEKLVGTPFEGMTIGDEVPAIDYFLCGQYQTTVINELPIKIFTAFFTEAEETHIAEGVAIANTAMGFTAYELTDTWSDDVRVIYKVSSTYLRSSAPYYSSAVAATRGRLLDFNVNDKNYADRGQSDWAILAIWSDAYTIAHELGHASGIIFHKLIDYDNDALLDLEPNSIMEANGGTELSDYTFMMKKQGELMQQHLGETDNLATDCE